MSKAKPTEPSSTPEQPPDPREEAITNLCDNVKSILSSTERGELDALHEVGVKILDAKGQDLYGPNVTKEVAKRLNTYRQKIQFSIRFAEAYDDAALDELKSYQTREDQPYVWSSTSVRYLLRVKDESQRASLAKECAENNWPSRKLQLEVTAIAAGGPGRAAKGPGAHLTAQLETILKFFTTWRDFVNLQASSGTNLFDKLNALGLKHLTEKQRSLVSQVITTSPGFTEKVCEMNGYLCRISMKSE